METAIGLRTITATRYVTPLREGGSLPGLVEADDDGLYVLKFRGAGQGAGALLAEVIVAELAREVSLPVPELVRAELDPLLGAAEPDPEIQELIIASAGTNLGVDFLPGALTFAPGGPWLPDPELAGGVVWLDALTTNVDRSPRNPNLLIWHQRPWLIDHGAALYLQHRGLRPEQDALRPFPAIAQHVLLPHAGSILAAHAELAPKLTRARLKEIVSRAPREWFVHGPAEDYVDYLDLRLRDGTFAQEAERARRAP